MPASCQPSLMNNSKNNTTVSRRRNITTVPCVICSDLTFGHNFGVPSCPACAAFFRCSIAKKRAYKCRFSKNCEITKDTRNGCRWCRLEKCLKVGMKPDLVQKHANGHTDNDESNANSPSKKHAKLYPNLSSQELHDIGQLDELLYIERCFARIRNSNTDLTDAYIDQFSSLEKLVACGENLIGRADQFSTDPPPPWDRDGELEKVQKFGIFSIRPKHRILDYLLCLGMVKTMPVYSKLDMPDRIHLFRAIALPFAQLTSMHYSALRGADTVTRPNGLAHIAFYRVPRYASDARAQAMTEHMYCAALRPWHALHVTGKEFVLLMHILLTNPVGSALSPHARDLLYAESCAYSSALLRLLQRTHGMLRGARRYAELLPLIGRAFRSMHYYHCFAAYMDAFHHTARARARVTPASIMPLYTQSSASTS